MSIRRFLVLSVMLMVVSVASAGDWPQWRGPNFNGSSDEKNLPADWSMTDNIVWSADLPGCSAATPIVGGGRVFISGIDSDKKIKQAMCFDRSNGRLLWSHEIGPGINRDNRSTFAASSPVTNGKIVVFFYSTGEVVCYDMAGQQKWARNICDDYGVFAFLWTFSSSPTLYDGKLYLQILQRDVPVRGPAQGKKIDSYLLCVNPADGKTIWRQIRPSAAVAESHEAYSTPLPFSIGGRMQMLVAGGDAITGHDPATGRELWRWADYNPRKVTSWRFVPSPVVGDGIALVCAPKGGPIYAVKPVDGKASVVWDTKDASGLTSDVPTPAFYDGDFFILSDLRKTLSRVEPTTGKVKWTITTPGKSKYEASPTAADGRIYLINHAGEAALINAADGKLLKVIKMDNPRGGELVRASITVSDGQLFLRATRKLYCIGK